MAHIKQIWALLEKATSLKNNAAKQKDWSYAPPEGGRPAAFLGEAPTVLGVGLPAPVCAVTDEEASKTCAAAHQLRRVGSFPLPSKLRRLASATGLAQCCHVGADCSPVLALGSSHPPGLLPPG
eukprot:648702-Alexandrium_andersonii.AAC.1